MQQETRPEGVPATARRKIAKVAVTALAIAAFGVAGFSGAMAKDGADDWGDWSVASGGPGWGDDVASGGWDDSWVFGSGGSSGWDDDWGVASGGWGDD